ncbi:hypothetical protein HDU93_008743 [Gonapodya sp. JEL0774]|nr:hypothetical protein HDU93_008743 [Gonapodya sp. JEL0774]
MAAQFPGAPTTVQPISILPEMMIGVQQMTIPAYGMAGHEQQQMYMATTSDGQQVYIPMNSLSPPSTGVTVALKGGSTPTLPNRGVPRKNFSPAEKAKMMALFEQNQNPTTMYPTLAAEFGRPVNSIRNWFQTERTKFKKARASSSNSTPVNQDSGDEDGAVESDSIASDYPVVPDPATARTKSASATTPATTIRLRMSNPSAAPPLPINEVGDTSTSFSSGASRFQNAESAVQSVALATLESETNAVTSVKSATAAAIELSASTLPAASTKIKLPIVKQQRPLPAPQPLPASFKAKPPPKVTTVDSGSDPGASDGEGNDSSEDTDENILSEATVEQFARRFKMLMAEDEIDDEAVSRMKVQVDRSSEEVRRRLVATKFPTIFGSYLKILIEEDDKKDIADALQGSEIAGPSQLLESLPFTFDTLKESKLGKIVFKLASHKDPAVKSRAEILIGKWKQLANGPSAEDHTSTTGVKRPATADEPNDGIKKAKSEKKLIPKVATSGLATKSAAAPSPATAAAPPINGFDIFSYIDKQTEKQSEERKKKEAAAAAMARLIAKQEENERLNPTQQSHEGMELDQDAAGTLAVAMAMDWNPVAAGWSVQGTEGIWNGGIQPQAEVSGFTQFSQGAGWSTPLQGGAGWSTPLQGDHSMMEADSTQAQYGAQTQSKRKNWSNDLHESSAEQLERKPPKTLKSQGPIYKHSRTKKPAKSILKRAGSTQTPKRVEFNDKQLTQVKEFVALDGEWPPRRVIAVSGGGVDVAQKRLMEDKNEGKRAYEQTRNAIRATTTWQELKPMVVVSDTDWVPRGTQSLEKLYQERRESMALSYTVIDEQYIPHSPAEPDPEELSKILVSDAQILQIPLFDPSAPAETAYAPSRIPPAQTPIVAVMPSPLPSAQTESLKQLILQSGLDESIKGNPELVLQLLQNQDLIKHAMQQQALQQSTSQLLTQTGVPFQTSPIPVHDSSFGFPGGTIPGPTSQPNRGPQSLPSQLEMFSRGDRSRKWDDHDEEDQTRDSRERRSSNTRGGFGRGGAEERGSRGRGGFRGGGRGGGIQQFEEPRTCKFYANGDCIAKATMLPYQKRLLGAEKWAPHDSY